MSARNTAFTIPKTISRSSFRTYDIRGIVGEDLDINLVYAIGLSVGSEAGSIGERRIIVGRDGRISSPSLSRALIQGLLDTGQDVIDIGIVPSPVLYYATHKLPSRSGVILTASHNPLNYNGLKIVLKGETLANQQIQAIYQRILNKNFLSGKGEVRQHTIVKDYIDRICQDIKLAKSFKVVIDCGNGVGGVIASQLFRKLGCEVVELFCEVDGNFPNHPPDPSDAENLQSLIATVRQQQADLGFAFDGDGDRLGVVTEKGDIIWPDRQLILFAIDVLARHPKATIVYDVKCTRYLAEQISAHQGYPLMVRTGHSLVKAKMREVGALLAGEMSGHIFFKERWYGFDDGFYAAARLLEILSRRHTTISNLFQSIPNSTNTPELRMPLEEHKKQAFMNLLQSEADFCAEKIIEIDGIRAEYSDGWGLVRPSNTTPCITFRFEADNQAALTRIQAVFKKQILRIDSTLALPF